jgi:hypothetical protein
VLHRLISAGRAAIVGPVRQELLSGIRDTGDLRATREHLASFPDERIVTADYEQAPSLTTSAAAAASPDRTLTFCSAPFHVSSGFRC